MRGEAASSAARAPPEAVISLAVGAPVAGRRAAAAADAKALKVAGAVAVAAGVAAVAVAAAADRRVQELTLEARGGGLTVKADSVRCCLAISKRECVRHYQSASRV